MLASLDRNSRRADKVRVGQPSGHASPVKCRSGHKEEYLNGDNDKKGKVDGSQPCHLPHTALQLTKVTVSQRHFTFTRFRCSRCGLR
jgi:hypothetical protein